MASAVLTGPPITRRIAPRELAFPCYFFNCFSFSPLSPDQHTAREAKRGGYLKQKTSVFTSSGNPLLYLPLVTVASV